MEGSIWPAAAAQGCEIGRPDTAVLPCGHPAKPADDRLPAFDVLGLAPTLATATAEESLSAPELRILGGTNDRANRGITAHLLVIGGDSIPLLQRRLHGEFPALTPEFRLPPPAVWDSSMSAVNHPMSLSWTWVPWIGPGWRLTSRSADQKRPPAQSIVITRTERLAAATRP